MRADTSHKRSCKPCGNFVFGNWLYSTLGNYWFKKKDNEAGG